MKKLEISITQAQLISFGVRLADGKPIVTAQIALLTEQGKAITTYEIGTESWRENKLELPVTALPLIGQLARALEVAVVQNCRDSQKLLPAPKEEPINLDEL